MSIFPDASPDRPVYLVCECGERLTLTAPPDTWPIACAACGQPVRRVDPETVRRPDENDPRLLPGPDDEGALPSVRRGGALRRADAEADLPGFGEEGGTVEISRRTFTGKVVTRSVTVRAPEAWGMETLALALWLATAMALMIGHIVLKDGELTAVSMVLQSSLFAAATTGFVLFQKTSVGPTLKAPPSVGFWLLLAVKLLPVTVGGVFLYFFLLAKVYGLDLGSDPTAGLLEDPESSLPLLLLAIGILPGFFEELGFRGWMQSIWRKMVSPRRALLLTAVAFTVVHFSILSIGWLLPMGIYLGWLRERSGSIWPGVIAHIGHNTAIVILAKVLA